MENVIKLETEHKNYDLKIESDNSTAYKDFCIECVRGGRIHSLNIKRYLDDDIEVLEMGSVTLRGREVSLFMDFLNQEP